MYKTRFSRVRDQTMRINIINPNLSIFFSRQSAKFVYWRSDIELGTLTALTPMKSVLLVKNSVPCNFFLNFFGTLDACLKVQSFDFGGCILFTANRAARAWSMWTHF